MVSIVFDEHSFNLVIAGLNELPARHSRELINKLLELKNEIEIKQQQNNNPLPQAKLP
jgi:hypothetical protein